MQERKGDGGRQVEKEKATVETIHREINKERDTELESNKDRDREKERDRETIADHIQLKLVKLVEQRKGIRQ